jgi:hypothetical protein
MIVVFQRPILVSIYSPPPFFQIQFKFLIDPRRRFVMTQHHDAVEHSGVLKSSEDSEALTFEHGGRAYLMEGTSGPSKTQSRMAEGSPKGTFTERKHELPADQGSGASKFELRVAEGKPVQLTTLNEAQREFASSGGQLVGGPVRRA